MRDRTTAHKWKNRARIIGVLVVMLLVLGLVTDFFSGLPLTRGSRSWATWLLGMLGFGTLYMLGEAAAGWIGGRDNVADPLSKRTFNLVLLLTLVLVFCVIAGCIVWMAQ